MLTYTSTRQIPIAEFQTPFRFGLDPDNRWVRLSQLIPWDELVSIYARSLRIDFGRPISDARVEIGALIIQHILKLSDEEVIEQIRENPYLQYFLGYADYHYRRVFDPSLLVTIRKRLGEAALVEINEAWILKLEQLEQKRQAGKRSPEFIEGQKRGKGKDKECAGPGPDKPVEADAGAEKEPGEEPEKCEENHQVKLLIDVTVAPCAIKYPTDLDLLDEGIRSVNYILKIPGEQVIF